MRTCTHPSCLPHTLLSSRMHHVCGTIDPHRPPSNTHSRNSHLLSAPMGKSACSLYLSLSLSPFSCSHLSLSLPLSPSLSLTHTHRWVPVMAGCYPTATDYQGLRIRTQDLRVPKYAANVSAPFINSDSHKAYYKSLTFSEAYSDAWLAPRMSVSGGQCRVAFQATIPGVYKWSFFALTKLGEDCPTAPTGFNKFGKPVYECSAVLRLDARSVTHQPGPHLVAVYPGDTDAGKSKADGQGLASSSSSSSSSCTFRQGAATAGVTAAFYIRSYDSFGNPRLAGGDAWLVSFSEDTRKGGGGDTSGACVSAQVENSGNGTYQVNYQSTCSARYWIHVSLDGEPLGRHGPMLNDTHQLASFAPGSDNASPFNVFISSGAPDVTKAQLLGMPLHPTSSMAGSLSVYLLRYLRLL